MSVFQTLVGSGGFSPDLPSVRSGLRAPDKKRFGPTDLEMVSVNKAYLSILIQHVFKALPVGF